VLFRLPFASLGAAVSAGSLWRFNLQRAAVLPENLDQMRPLAIVRSPKPPRHDRKRKHAVEWATWSVPYARVDAPDRLGWIEFE